MHAMPALRWCTDQDDQHASPGKGVRALSQGTKQEQDTTTKQGRPFRPSGDALAAQRKHLKHFTFLG